MKTLKCLLLLCLVQLLCIAVYALSSHQSSPARSEQTFDSAAGSSSDDAAIYLSMVNELDDPFISETMVAEKISYNQEQEINYPPKGTTYDFCIQYGIPQYTRDGGTTWEELPVSSSSLQNSWQTYLKMGPQSYIITDDLVILAFEAGNGDATLLVGNVQGVYYLLTIDLDDQIPMQMSLSQNEDGVYQLVIFGNYHSFVCGTSLDGMTWEFERAKYTYEDVLYSGALNFYSMPLMDDGSILLVYYDDVAVSTNGGVTFARMSSTAPEIAAKVDTGSLPYDDHEGNWYVPLKDGTTAVSEDHVHWSIQEKQ